MSGKATEREREGYSAERAGKPSRSRVSGGSQENQALMRRICLRKEALINRFSEGDRRLNTEKSLKLKESVIPIAKAGGTIGRSQFFDGAIDAELHRVAPKANVIVLPMKPAEAAARMALKLGKRKA